MVTFNPPVTDGIPAADPSLAHQDGAHALWRYYGSWAMGKTIWKDQNGTWHEAIYPYQGGDAHEVWTKGVKVVDIADTSVQSLANAVKVYQGGHVYEVTEEEADDLIEAGYGEFLGEYLLEKAGAQVPQTMTTDYRELWLDFIRDAGDHTNGRRILGGDCVNVVQITASNWIWLWLDVWAGGTGAVDGDDTYAGAMLPFRNAVASEVPQGTLGGQVFTGGGSGGNWIDASEGGFPSSYVWWPTGGVRVDLSGTTYVIAHLLDTAGPSENFGIIRTSLISLNGFGLYGSHVDIWHGANGEFWADRMVQDGNLIYIWGQEILDGVFPEPSDLAGWSQPWSGGLKVARVAAATLTDQSTWEFWDGTAWTKYPLNAATLKDDAGNKIRGFTGTPYKVAEGHWVTVSRSVVLDPFLDVWRSESPQGPWTKISRVPVPRIGETVGPGYVQVSHHATILPHIPAPPDHSVAMLTSTIIGFTGTVEFDDLSIECFAPQFVVIPHEAS